jgi:hypothetical protein
MNLRNILTLSLAVIVSLPEAAKAAESEVCDAVRTNVTAVAVEYKRGNSIDPSIVEELKTQVDLVKGSPLCSPILVNQMAEVLRDLSKSEASKA